MLWAILILLAGLAALIVGGELLVRGAVQIAERLGMSQMLIGLTIVGFGTSTPELAASVEAALAGSPGIAWGNIVGSNITNALLILGGAAIIAPLAVPRGPLWRDGGIGLLATLLLWAMAYAGVIGAVYGVIALILLAAYLVYAYQSEKIPERAHQTALAEKAEALELADSALHRQHAAWVSALILVAGLALIILGGGWLVEGAIDLATLFGLSEAIIGLTIVAIGTSMPELVTSLIAARKGAGDVALGNVLGSNLFNLLFIGGITALVAPSLLPAEIMTFSLPFLVMASLVLLLLAYSHFRLTRWEGALLLLLFAGQMAYSLTAV
jgi:cation:H+ antiporter